VIPLASNFRYTILANLTNGFGYNVAIMRQARNATAGLAFPARAFTVDFLASERSEITDSLSSQAISSTIIAVFAVSLFALSPIEAVLITISVTMVVLDLIGMMALWDVDLNVTSIVFLCLAVGFSVDYAAHVVKSISDQDHTLTVVARVRIALTSQGVAVLHAALSTLVATIMLSVASSLGFRILFRLLFGTVIFGILHGLVFLPAALMVLPQSWTVIPSSKPAVHSAVESEA
jgi:predicted RND superfamily exporter protein